MYTKKELAQMEAGEKIDIIKEYVRSEGGAPSHHLCDREHERCGCKAVRTVSAGGELRVDSGQHWNGSVMKRLYLWAFYLNDKDQLCLQCGGRNDRDISEAACYDPVPEGEIAGADLDRIILEWEL